MKKIIFIFLVLLIIIFNIDIKAFRAKRIDLNIVDNEISVVFIRLKDSVSLLINDEDDSNLFIIWYKNDKMLKEAVKIFNSTPNIFYLNKNIDKIIDNIHVFRKEGVLKFRINNYTLCVNDGDIGSCDFVYLLDLDNYFKVNENLLNVFYDEFVDKKYLKNLEESWIDSTIVSISSFTILKITEENYNVLVVPSTNEEK